MSNINIAEIIFSGSLAYLAFFPAALAMIFNYYYRRRVDGVPADRLRSVRILIYIGLLSLALVFVAFVTSLWFIITRSLGGVNFPATPNALDIAFMGLFGSVTLMVFTVGLFIVQFFVNGEKD